METQNRNLENWLIVEEKALESENPDAFKKRPSLKLEENKIVEVSIDFSKPFDKRDVSGGLNGGTITKAIIPLTHNGEQKNFWLNIKNPLYAELIRAGRTGKTNFKILQTGKLQSTKYQLVE